MRFLPLLVPWLLVIWCEMVLGKFVKIENLHSIEDSKDNWDNYGKGGPTMSPSTEGFINVLDSALHGRKNQSTLSRSYRYGSAGGAKVFQSVNEVQLDRDSDAEGLRTKEWKSLYYPHGTSSTSGVPFGWSINNNNLLNVPYASSVPAAAPTDLMYNKPATIQCVLVGVMGLVTFLLNSVMGLLLSAKLPGLGLEGLLGPLLGFGHGLGALNKQDTLAVDTKAKSMVLFPDANRMDQVELIDKIR